MPEVCRGLNETTPNGASPAASRIAGKVQILQATSGANSTSYLYGLNQIAEFGSQSVYYLTDGAGSIRHLVDPNGAVKLARMYEPFGQVLMQKGVGDPTYGYLGAQFDRISGLLYINGAYYDPVTGRFLSPSSSGSNPYVPLGGAALAPILLLALIGRKKKGQIWTGWLVIALMMSVGLMLTACDSEDKENKSTETATPSPIPGINPTKPPTAVPIPPATATSPAAIPQTPPVDQCQGYSGQEPGAPPNTPWNSMDDYYAAQEQYAKDRTNSYVPDEQMLARMIWNEQRNEGSSAMIAAAWSVINRKNDKIYFGHVNTIQAVLEDTQCSSSDTSGRCKQYHGYPGTDPLPVIARMGSGPGFRTNPDQPNDRELWFMALDIARKVINGCEQDPTKGYLWFGNGANVMQRMESRKTSVEGFDYILIPKTTNLYFSNLPY